MAGIARAVIPIEPPKLPSLFWYDIKLYMLLYIQVEKSKRIKAIMISFLLCKMAAAELFTVGQTSYSSQFSENFNLCTI